MAMRKTKRTGTRVHDRALLKSPVDKHTGVQPELVNQEPGPSPNTNLKDFLSSTPAWTAVGAMIGAAASSVSIWIVAFVAWLIVCIEFWARKFFQGGFRRHLANISFPIALAVVLGLIVRRIPKQAAMPTVDQQADAVLNGIEHRFPWLGEKPVGHTPAAPDLPKPEVSTPIISHKQSGRVEIFFTGGMRGEEEKIGTEAQRKALLTSKPETSKSRILALPIYAQDKEVHLTFFVRNASLFPIKNLRVIVSSRACSHYELVFC